MTAAAAPLGILAGRGKLPRRIVEVCRQSGRAVFVLGFAGQIDAETLANVPCAMVRLGAVGQAVAALREAGAVELVMAGKIERPSMASLRPDAHGLRLLARIGARAWGEDGVLRILADELEREGFRVIGVHDLLPNDLAPKGLLGRHAPDPQAERDIAHGLFVAGLLGQADIGQAVIVQQGMVLGVEAIEGTDALIERCRALARPGPGGVLVKRAKPQQDDRLDLPAVGPATLAAAHRAGLCGLAIEAGRTLLIERKRLVADADRHGLFVIAMETPR